MNEWPKGVAKPAIRALAQAGYERLEQLHEVDEQVLSQLHGMGPKAMDVIKKSLEERGLKFK